MSKMGGCPYSDLYIHVLRPNTEYGWTNLLPDRDAAFDHARLRRLLFEVALAVTNPDKDHVDRCVDVQAIVGSAEDWRE